MIWSLPADNPLPGGDVRPESKIKVNVRHTLIGGQTVAVCLPLVAGQRSVLLDQARHSARMKPDLLEWRIDHYDGVDDAAECLALLEALRTAIGDIPLIFTCRIHSEGGARQLPQHHRQKLIEGAIRSGHADIVDIEMRNAPDFIEAVKDACRTAGTPLMLSYHDFKETRTEGFIRDTLAQAWHLGADIAKMAVMPRGYEDVLTLMKATLRARRQAVDIPIVTMSMGAMGAITRIAGGLFGSDITFAMGEDASAPGQIPIQRLRQAMEAVYNG
jgi:3-dehydroquinate dehydratase-1